MRTRIWTESTKMKHDVEYLRTYILFQGKVSRILNVLILVFSSSGVLSWSMFESPQFIGIVCSITAGISLIKLISPYIILSEKETKKLDKYYTLLINDFDKIEKFWYDNENGEISEKKITDRFYKITASINEINDRYGDLNILHLKKLTQTAKRNSDEYFKNNFNL